MAKQYITANIDLVGHCITNIGSPSKPEDAANMKYVDEAVLYALHKMEGCMQQIINKQSVMNERLMQVEAQVSRLEKAVMLL